MGMLEGEGTFKRWGLVGGHRRLCPLKGLMLVLWSCSQESIVTKRKTLASPLALASCLAMPDCSCVVSHCDIINCESLTSAELIQSHAFEIPEL
jgi:hypothetical protein